MALANSETINVAAWLPVRAAEQPQKPAIIWRSSRDSIGRAIYSHYTFQQLNTETDACAFGLQSAGITRGTRTILMVRPSPEFFVLTFALYKIGAVPVLIDPGMGRRNMVECLRATNAEAFIGIPLAHILRILNPSAFKNVRTIITAGPRYLWRGHTLTVIRKQGATIMASKISNFQFQIPNSEISNLKSEIDLLTDAANANLRNPQSKIARSPNRHIAKSPAFFPIAETAPTDPAAIIFTTGSTGPPKGVLYRHGMFDAQVRILRERFYIQPDEIDLPTFPLFALFDPALGMSAVIPEMDFTRPALVDPAKIIEAVRDNNVTHMFGSPALLDRVGRYGEIHNTKLPSLRRVISAGAPVPPATIERFCKMFESPTAKSPNQDQSPDHQIAKSPNPQIFTPYGATEALPVAVIGSGEILAETAALTAQGLGTCVGRPVPYVDVRIIRITDEPIAEWSDDLELPIGQVGEITVKGPVVTREYFTSEAATRLAKIHENSSGDMPPIWHRMGDLGRFDSQGRLWFYGRKAHRVITETGTLFTEQVEAIFNQHPKVRRSALVGIGHRPNQTPVVCIEVDESALEPNDHKYPNAFGEELFALGAKHEFTKGIDTFLIHPGFPVDIRHNSKIFREKLAIWASTQVG